MSPTTGLVVSHPDKAYQLADVVEDIISTLGKSTPYPTSFATIHRPTASGSSTTYRAAEKAPALRSLTPPGGVEEGECVIWYLGEEGRSSLNLQMTHAANPVCLAYKSRAHKLTNADLRLYPVLFRNSAAYSYIPPITKALVCPSLSDGLRRIRPRSR
jgi:hypothetical protein